MSRGPGDLLKRLLVIADPSVANQTVRSTLRQTPGLHVVGCLDGCRPLRARLLELRPDVVLVDEMQNHEHGLERLREAADVLPGAKRLVLTARMDDGWLEDAFDAGADAAVSKVLHPVALGTLLRETIRGNVIHRFRPARPTDSDCPLTSREIEILALAAQGYTNGRIARELWVTEQTVKFHLSNTYRKLGVANRTEASRYAYVNALVKPEEELAC
jgi:DNA-binding NarL/FixJ family response regulator